MKKFIILLLTLSLSLCLCACGEKEDSLPEITLPEQQSYEGSYLPPEKTPEPEKEKEERPHLPLPPEGSDFYRGTWISGGEANINDTLDHYYGIDLNYLCLTSAGSGVLVLGGKYEELLYTLDGSTLTITLSRTGDRFLGSVLSPEITEINYMNSGKLMTFIKLSPEDTEKVIKDLGLGK